MRIITIILLLVSALLAFYTLTDSQPIESNPIVITADDLRNEFTLNPTQAQEKYKNKILQITGIVFERAQPKDNIPKTNASYLAFGDHSKDEVLLLCYFDTVFATSGIKKGDTITLQGEFKTFSQKGLKIIILEKSNLIDKEH